MTALDRELRRIPETLSARDEARLRRTLPGIIPEGA